MADDLDARSLTAFFVTDEYGYWLLLEEANRDQVRSSLNQICLTVFWGPASSDSISMRYVDRFTSLVGRWPTYSEPLFHAAILLLATAVREGGPRSSAIHGYLPGLGESREPYMGMTGPISFNDERTPPLHMIKADGLPG